MITEGEVDKKGIIRTLETLIPEYMIPGKFISIEKMPLNANGKIDRVKLRDYIG